MVLACLAGAVSAVGAVATAEQFPGEGRLSGLALGATLATAIFGGATPFIAQLLTDRTGWPLIPGVIVPAPIRRLKRVLPVLLALPEHYRAAGEVVICCRHQMGCT